MNKLYSMLPIFLQNIALSIYGYKLKKIRYSKHFYERLKFLEKSLYWSEDELTHYQEKQLQKLIKYVYSNIPYYREVMMNLNLKPSDFNTLEDLKKLPILTKKDIITNYQKLINPKIKEKYSFVKTSGSSGTPLSIMITDKAVAYEYANTWRQRNLFNIHLKDKLATFNGRMIIDPDSNSKILWRRNYTFNQTLFSLAHLKKENIPYIVNEFNKTKYDYINGYPSTLEYIANIILEKNLQINSQIKRIFTSSETLNDNAKKVIEKAFRTKISDRYSSAERVCSFMQYNDDLYYHNSEDGFIELLEHNTGYKKIICTGFNNYAMPLIRYDIGDLVDDNIHIKKSFNRLVVSKIIGREDDVIFTPDGRVNGRLDHIFKGLKEINRCQIIQEDLNTVIFKIETTFNFTQKQKVLLLKNAEERLGKMKFIIETVDEIPLSKNGKFKAVINKVKI